MQRECSPVLGVMVHRETMLTRTNSDVEGWQCTYPLNTKARRGQLDVYPLAISGISLGAGGTVHDRAVSTKTTAPSARRRRDAINGHLRDLHVGN